MFTQLKPPLRYRKPQRISAWQWLRLSSVVVLTKRHSGGAQWCRLIRLPYGTLFQRFLWICLICFVWKCFKSHTMDSKHLWIQVCVFFALTFHLLFFALHFFQKQRVTDRWCSIRSNGSVDCCKYNLQHVFQYLNDRFILTNYLQFLSRDQRCESGALPSSIALFEGWTVIESSSLRPCKIGFLQRTDISYSYCKGISSSNPSWEALAVSLQQHVEQQAPCTSMLCFAWNRSPSEVYSTYGLMDRPSKSCTSFISQTFICLPDLWALRCAMRQFTIKVRWDVWSLSLPSRQVGPRLLMNCWQQTLPSVALPHNLSQPYASQPNRVTQ